MPGRVATVERLDEGADLIARPDVPALELGELQAAFRDVGDELVYFRHVTSLNRRPGYEF
jgi:hypothetical protein